MLGTLVETMVALAPTGDSDAGAAGAVGVGVAVEGICAAAVTDRLAQAFQRAAGRTCVRPASPGRGDLTVYLNSRHKREVGRDSDRDGNGAGGGGGGQRGRADVVIDLSDPRWPVIRRMAARLPTPPGWYVAECQAFFAGRAASWDSKFGDDLPAYAAAVAHAAPAPGSTVLDLGCGTGRALPALRSAVGPAGTVIAADLTPQMLEAARAAGRAGHSVLVLADAQSLPFADARIDTIIAAGLINHLHDLHGGLRELARVTRPGGQLVVFHPTGRAALAARHGRTLRPDEPLSERELPRHLAATGWRQTYYDDAPHRFLALASRE
ncbi:MAG TPA: methyltransferase domain-containing protein [Actinocrinis sp.]